MHEYISEVEIFKIISNHYNQKIFDQTYKDLYARKSLIAYFIIKADAN